MDAAVISKKRIRSHQPFPLKPWVERLSRYFLLRPFVFLLVSLLAGGYIAFFLQGSCLLFFSSGVSLFLIILIILKRVNLKELISVCIGVIGFSVAFVYFCQERYIMENRISVEQYQGGATITSNNSTDEGYKNLVLALDTGEKVILLTESRYEYGTVLEIDGRLEPIRSKGNPGDMDVRAYYKKAGIVRCLVYADLQEKTDIPISPIVYGYRIGDRISQMCYSEWLRVTDPDTAMLLAAMVVGDDSHLSSDVKADFRSSNLSHLLVVSGAHVGYFASTIIMLTSALFSDQKRRTAVLIGALVFFGFVSGWSGTAARSIFSYIFVCVLSDGKRGVDRVSVCAASATIIIFFDPYAMFSSGMLLSFGATFSIMLFRERLEKFLKKRLAMLPVEIRRSVACFLCAQLGMLPIMLSIGSSLSLPDLAVLVLVGFPAEIMCSLGFPLTVISLLCPGTFLGSILFIPIRGIALILKEFASIGANNEFSRFSVRDLPILLLISIVSAILGLIIHCGLRRKVLLMSCVFSLLLFFFRAFSVSDISTRVYFMNVGQGDCALILHDKYAFLIDGGKRGNGEVIEKTMEYLGIEKIDVAFASHLDIDHIGGILELYSEGKIDYLYTSFWSDSPEMEQLRSVWDDLPVDLGILKAGDRVVIDENLVFEVIWPVCASDGGNEDSLVLLADISGTSVLFTGDISRETEKKILNDLPESIDVLKVSHHGSRFSTSEDFLENKIIGAAVISVGYNLYGHPSPEVLMRLSNSGIPVYRTDEEGCVLLSVSDDHRILDYYFA